MSGSSVTGSTTGHLAGAIQAKSSLSKSEYDALRDPDLRRFLQAPQTVSTLLTAGLLTSDGRILNTESPGMKGRLRVIEQELEGAADEEASLKKEEATVRVSYTKNYVAISQNSNVFVLWRLR